MGLKHLEVFSGTFSLKFKFKNRIISVRDVKFSRNFNKEFSDLFLFVGLN